MTTQEITYRITEDNRVILENVDTADSTGLLVFLNKWGVEHTFLEQTNVKGEASVRWLICEKKITDKHNTFFFLDATTFAIMLRAVENLVARPEDFLANIYSNVADRIEPTRERDRAAGQAIFRTLQYNIVESLKDSKKNQVKPEIITLRWLHVMQGVVASMIERYDDSLDILATLGTYNREFLDTLEKQFQVQEPDIVSSKEHSLALLCSPQAYTKFIELGPYPIEAL